MNNNKPCILRDKCGDYFNMGWYILIFIPLLVQLDAHLANSILHTSLRVRNKILLNFAKCANSSRIENAPAALLLRVQNIIANFAFVRNISGRDLCLIIAILLLCFGILLLCDMFFEI